MVDGQWSGGRPRPPLYRYEPRADEGVRLAELICHMGHVNLSHGTCESVTRDM